MKTRRSSANSWNGAPIVRSSRNRSHAADEAARPRSATVCDRAAQGCNSEISSYYSANILAELSEGYTTDLRRGLASS
jgi:hypothetical protein